MSNILIVEDDRTTRLLITKTLEAAGFEVAIATDGVDALERMQHQPFDLILLDIWMPRMNGLELLSKLRKEGARVKAIVMTADDTPRTLLQAIREEAYHYLAKPIDPTALVEEVQSVLASSETPPIEVVSARPEWVELLVPCDMNAAERIKGFIARLETDLPEETRESIGRVFHEMLMNAIEWGGQLDPTRKVRIACLRARRMLLYRIADPGPGFNPEDLDHAAISHSDPTKHMEVRAQKALRPGGFGILLARASVDELLYNEAHNEVVFVKYLDTDPA